MNNKNVSFDKKRTSQWMPKRNEKSEKEEVIFYANVNILSNFKILKYYVCIYSFLKVFSLSIWV